MTARPKEKTARIANAKADDTEHLQEGRQSSSCKTTIEQPRDRANMASTERIEEQSKTQQLMDALHNQLRAPCRHDLGGHRGAAPRPLTVTG